MSRQVVLSFTSWVGCVSLAVCLGGCPKRQSAKPRMAKSKRPILKMRSHKGNRLQYAIFNTSGVAFKGMAIVIDGETCHGPRSKRLLIRLDRRPLKNNTMRPYDHRMPYKCSTFRLKAYSYPEFSRFLKQKHHPIVRYSRKNRTVSFQVENHSILPFRGLAIVVRGQECEDGPETRYWTSTRRLWLYPGYTHRANVNLPVDCQKVQVIAKDLVAFLRSRRAFLKSQQNKSKPKAK